MDHYEPGVWMAVAHLAELHRQADRQRLASRIPGWTAGRRGDRVPGSPRVLGRRGQRALGWLLGGRDGRLLLVTMGALVGAPVAALVAVTATSALSLGLRVAFLRRPPGA